MLYVKKFLQTIIHQFFVQGLIFCEVNIIVWFMSGTQITVSRIVSGFLDPELIGFQRL